MQHFAKAFIKLGLDPRHSVGIIAFNSPEWLYAELATIFAGGLAAGIYTTNSAEPVRHILEKSRANICIVDDEKQMAKVQSIKDQLPLLKTIVQLNGPLDKRLTHEEGYYTWQDVEEMNVDDAEQEYANRLSQITPNNSATLIFTVRNKNLQYYYNCTLTVSLSSQVQWACPKESS